MKESFIAGSPLWQTVFVSFAVVLLLFEVVRGWRLGLPRQLVRLGALLAAYAAAFFGGGLLLPFLRPVLQVPDFVISAVGGIILAAVVYSIINAVGTILFKRTAQQGSSLVRMVYGITGAVLGLFFGIFFIWLLVIGIRSIGAVAEAQTRAATPRSSEDLVASMARLKNSIELGPVGEVVRQADILPAGVYETLAKLGETFSKPERASRFLSYPGVAEVADHPKILALRADPEIQRLLAEGKFWQLLQDPRLIEVANDPEIARAVKRFDLRKALGFAEEEKEKP